MSTENTRKPGFSIAEAGKATRWQKGQSGNPHGRPKRTPLTDACREVLAKLVPGDPLERTYAQAIAQLWADKAIKGDVRAGQELANRAEGYPPQSVGVELDAYLAPMSREQIEARVVELLAKAPELLPPVTSEGNDNGPDA